MFLVKWLFKKKSTLPAHPQTPNAGFILLETKQLLAPQTTGAPSACSMGSSGERPWPHTCSTSSRHAHTDRADAAWSGCRCGKGWSWQWAQPRVGHPVLPPPQEPGPVLSRGPGMPMLSGSARQFQCPVDSCTLCLTLSFNCDGLMA